MSELVYTRPELTGLVIFGEVEICHSTQTGATETDTYLSELWSYRGTVPLTVTLLRSSSYSGEHLVQRMTESGYGSPLATPCVKFNWLALKGEA